MKVINKIGDEELMDKEKTLFLCSKHTPCKTYHKIFDWVESLCDKDCVVCFKSTQMEYEVMSSLLVNKIPTILVVMNKFTDVNNIQIETAIKEGRMLIVVLKRDEPRGSGQTPRLRNEFVIGMVDKIVCGYIDPNGSIFGLLAGRTNVEFLMNRNEMMAAENMEKKHNRWSVAEDKILLRMFYEDKGVHAIKKRLGRPYSSVIDRISSITMPEEMLKGREFEDYVLNEVLGIGNNNTIKLLEWRGDKIAGGIFPESNRYPDFVISIGCGKKVSLECKWRQQLRTNLRKDIFSDERIEIFNTYSTDNSIPVWFIIGEGGEPSAPETLYLVPLSAVNDILKNRHRITDFLCKSSLDSKSFVSK